MIEFAGWEMPLRYPDGVIAEHLAVRGAAGAFDVSHMGQIECAGPDALALLARVCCNDVAAIAISGAQYGLLLREDGGVLDDVFNYRLEAERHIVSGFARSQHDDQDGAIHRTRQLVDAVTRFNSIDPGHDQIDH